MKFSSGFMVMCCFGVLVAADEIFAEGDKTEPYIMAPMKRPFCNRFGGCSAAAGRMAGNRKRWGFQPESPVAVPQQDNLAAFASPELEEAVMQEVLRQKLRDIFRT
ncbi:hypothetical protein BV898_00580 [Hypsibius exemplaris]|uniref:Cardioactive peptide n=1 Tax=Hypsibius exemplaris TaxID=2072580 RepID=A0A1W0XDU2_HYPEX|nr:hypothetical protein BV898_00580 [Hypsibius exemplaris]